MHNLKQNAELKDYQQYIKDIATERGWNKNSTLEIFLLFMEEVGELAKEIRYKLKLHQTPGKTFEKEKMENEFADVFNYFLDLANAMNIDLEQAFRNKEKKNTQRIWLNKKD